mmetsp:Transcript_74912/g.231410  ORF Transcript_74912/g.231410 Transcript_74912/m.231410 type:complete len:600 (+) Transcript_74912:250-2049(+)
MHARRRAQRTAKSSSCLRAASASSRAARPCPRRSSAGRGLQRPIDVLLVLVQGPRPVEVRADGVGLHLAEHVLVVLEDVHRLVQPFFEGVLLKGREEEARGSLSVAGHVPQALDRVLQAACLVNHRQGGILLGIHLGQPARLVLRRHENEVAARHHAVLHVGVEAHVAADAALVHALGLLDLPGVLLVAFAHHDHLHAAVHAVALVLQQPAQDAGDQVYALLVAEPATETQQAEVGILVESQLLLQLLLAEGLCLHEVLGSKVPGDRPVRDWAPLVRDAVENATHAQHRPFGSQHLVHAKTPLRRLDLIAVVRGDREHPVTSLDARLQQVQAVHAHVQILALQVAYSLCRQAEVRVDRKAAFPVLALVAQVVDHQNGTCRVVGPVETVLVEEVDRHEARLPVIGNEEAVLAIGGAPQGKDERSLSGRDGEQGESEEVVLILLASIGVAIKAGRPVETVVFHEDEIAPAPAAILLPQVEVLHFVLPAVQPYLCKAAILRMFVVVIARTHGHCAVAAHGKLLCVGACHHPQAARLRPGIDLRRDHNDVRAQVARAVPGRPVLGLGGLLHLCSERRHLVRLEELLKGRQTGNPGHAAETAGI